MSYSRRNAKGMDEANSPVLRRLKDFQGESSRVIQVQNVESMLNRVRREIALESTEKLARVQEAFADLVHFNHISSDELENVVALLDTITFEAGKIIVDQGCLAENWFILFQGKVSVLQKQVDGDGLEKMAEALSLQPGDSFEDHAVLCGEPYTLTYRASGPVTLLSLPAAELHSLSDLDISKRSSISTAKAPDKIEEASSIHPPIPVHAILDTVPVFAPLDAAQKATVIDALVEVKFRKGAYICEEGKLGNTFYIITSGECRVTVSNKEVARLGVSDFFGEVALIERTARTATVQAVTPVWCYSLSQRNFNMYLGHLKSKLMEHSASKQLMEMAEEEDFNDVHTDRDGTTPGSDGMTAFFSAALRRRSRRNMASVASHLINIQRTRRSMVSIASNDGQETENVIAEEETQFGEVSRLGQRVRFLAKKIMAVHYISAFSILLDFIMMAPKDSFPEYSKIASDLLTPNLKSWNQAIDMLRNTTLSGLNHKHNRVTDAELAVISAILRVRPGWKRRYAADWPSFQWNDLIRHMKSECAASLERVYVAGSHGKKAYFILSGLVRVLAKVTNKTTGEISYVYKGHLQPGDSFGDNVLEGFHTRVHTIICVTNVVLLTVHCEDYAKVRDHGTYITVGEKFQFARTCSLIKNMELYRLYRLALILLPAHFSPDALLIKKGDVSRSLYFILHGTVSLVQRRKKGGVDQQDRVLATLGMGEYFGESGVLQKLARHAAIERYTIKAATSLEVLKLRSKHFHLLDSEIVTHLSQGAEERKEWRQRRRGEARRGCQSTLTLARRGEGLSTPSTSFNLPKTLFPASKSLPLLSDDLGKWDGNPKHTDISKDYGAHKLPGIHGNTSPPWIRYHESAVLLPHEDCKKQLMPIQLLSQTIK